MINPLIGSPLLDGLSALSAGMTGQSLSDAYNEHITGSFTDSAGVTIGIGNMTTDKPAINGHTTGTIHNSSLSDPVDAWHDYVENELPPVSEVTGGIVDGSAVTTYNYSLIETSNNGVQAVANIGVPIEQVYVAFAQVLGVSMDTSEMDQELKDKFAEGIYLSGFTYDKDNKLVAAWVDKDGTILFPRPLLGIVKDILDEENIGPGISYSELIPTPFKSGSYSYTYSGTSSGRPYKITISDSYDHPNTSWLAEGGVVLNWLVAGGAPVDYTVTRVTIREWTDTHETDVYTRQSSAHLDFSYSYAGKTVYYRYGSDRGEHSSPSNINTSAPSSDVGAIAWSLVYGVNTGGNYPPGTAESRATHYAPEDVPDYGGIATSPYDTFPVVPVNLTEDPTNTMESTADPISSSDDDRTSDLPVPPVPLPIPDTNPSNPDIPLTDSSVVDSTLINELVEELANTLDPQPEQSSGIIPVPPLPGIFDPSTGHSTFPSIIPSSGPGFIHVYNPTPAEFVAFGSWLWVTYADATIDKILNNPFDGVIGAHELYATPNRDGRDNIRSAFLTCPTTADLVTNRYSEIDCGTVIVPEFYGNYLDYSPYSQAYIYLPFIGIMEVSIDDIVGHAVNIRYRVDSYSGSCIAMIFVAKDGYQNLCYQFSGSCSVEVPMSGGSQAAIKAAEMQAEAYAGAAQMSAVGHLFGGIGSALMGNIGGLLYGMGSVASDYANAKAGVEAARVANKSSVQHSGQFGASHGAMGQKIPFIIVRNPIQVKVVNYNNDYGFPAHKRVIIGGCTGYLRVREVNVVSAHATDEEKMLIETMLKNGVYVS